MRLNLLLILHKFISDKLHCMKRMTGEIQAIFVKMVKNGMKLDEK